MIRQTAAALLLTLGLAACADPRAAENLKQSQAFLAGNAKANGVVTLPSGLEYRVVTAGPAGGASPAPSDKVLVNYEGKLLNDQVFDSSYKRGAPDVFTVNQLIPAWTEALQLMHPGDEWVLYAPPNLAYGTKGVGPIPPNAALIFRIELIKVLPADLSVGKG
jgi:FKBP-type peptidyl-prolyl cis-trans isomerase